MIEEAVGELEGETIARVILLPYEVGRGWPRQLRIETAGGLVLTCGGVQDAVFRRPNGSGTAEGTTTP